MQQLRFQGRQRLECSSKPRKLCLGVGEVLTDFKPVEKKGTLHNKNANVRTQIAVSGICVKQELGAIRESPLQNPHG